MPVLVQTFGRQVPPPTPIPTFVDTFARFAQPERRICMTNDNLFPWRLLVTEDTTRASLVGFQAPQALLGGITMAAPGVLNLETVGAGGVFFHMHCWLTPEPFWGLALSGVAQFSEYRIVADTSVVGTTIRCGPAVFCKNGRGNGYVLQINGELGTMALYRNIGTIGDTVPVLLIPGGGAMVFAFGDVLRLEITPAPGPNNTLVVKRNGVQVGTVVDNNSISPGLTVPTIGVPGIAMLVQTSNAAFQTIDDYSGGPL